MKTWMKVSAPPIGAALGIYLAIATQTTASPIMEALPISLTLGLVVGFFVFVLRNMGWHEFKIGEGGNHEPV